MFGASRNYAVRLALLAVALELTVSANLLTFAGVPYVTDGGSPLFKLHPGTYVLMFAFLVFILQRGSWSLIVCQTAAGAFLGFLLACLLYAAVLTGTGNLIVLIDTFLPAGLLACALSLAREHQLQHLRSLLRLLLAANAALALVEVAVQTNLIPLYLNETAYHPHAEDFRPTALLDHPLTGSVMAMLGLALTPRYHRWRLAYSMLMWAALVAYGGRVAVAATLLAAFAHQVAHTGNMILRRRPQAARRILWATTVLTSAVLLTALAASLGLGTRLAGHLYWDDSAQVRLAQWQLLSQLDNWQLLLGTQRSDMLALLVPLRLGTGVEVIENFWLLMFVSLGLFGFLMFLGALLALLTWCWQLSSLQGRLLIVAVTLVVSASNSIGRKSNILVCLVATVACMSVRERVVSRRHASSSNAYWSAAA